MLEVLNGFFILGLLVGCVLILSAVVYYGLTSFLNKVIDFLTSMNHDNNKQDKSDDGNG